MPLLTTCIGSYPKPAYVPRMDWMHEGLEVGEVEGEALSPVERLAAFDRATQEVVAEQAAIGIDIPTDGEVRRANYIHYHCSHWEGFEPDKLTLCTMRGGAWTAEVPTFTGRVAAREPFLVRDWAVAQAATEKPVKITVPGPLTIADSTANTFYPDRRSRCADLADALNVEIGRLAEAGCRHIQVDEPLFARLPDQALDYGIETLERCFHGVPGGLTRTMHMCCGYPDRLDETDYAKADPEVYRRLAGAVEASTVDAVSIEDTHRHNDLALLDDVLPHHGHPGGRRDRLQPGRDGRRDCRAPAGRARPHRRRPADRRARLRSHHAGLRPREGQAPAPRRGRPRGLTTGSHAGRSIVRARGITAFLLFPPPPVPLLPGGGGTKAAPPLLPLLPAGEERAGDEIQGGGIRAALHADKGTCGERGRAVSPGSRRG